MSFRELLEAWEQSAQVQTTDTEYHIRLPVDDAAKLHALAEMYPGVGLESIITDLLSTALNELAESMPYEAGDTVIREDDHGDPVYEDTGLTPRFMALVRKHRSRLATGGD